MKRILTGLFAILLVLTLCTAVMTVSASAADNAAEQTPAPTAENAGGEAEPEMTFGDRLAKAGQVTLQGLGTVFAVLALLWGVIEIFHAVMHKSDKKDKKKTERSVAPEKKEMVSAPVETAAEPVYEADDGELVAAITAAVAAYLASEGDATYAGGFRVVSFRRSGNGSAWNKK